MAISAFDVKRVTLEDTNDEADDLHYSFRAAKELGHLTSMVSLKRLNLSFNELSHVRGVQYLQQLQHINLSHNALSSLDPVSSLRCLTSLIAGYNQISSTSALAVLPTLKVLALHSNAIDKPSAVLLLSDLTSLQHLTLANNPVCKQQDWQQATIAALSWLQALDSLVLSDADRMAARAHVSNWHRAVEVGDLSYSSSGSASSSRTCSAAGQTAGAAMHSPQSSRQLSRSTEAGRLALQHGNEASISFKDAASLLPSLSKPQLKPSSRTVRTASNQGQQQQPSRYGYSQAKPIRVVHQQRYEGSASAAAAIVVRSDGSAGTQWPDGSMAATLSVDDSTTAAAASFKKWHVGGYRLLAMYRNVVGVAASFDSNGGFVQYPDGGLMLVWNKKDGVGRCYAPDGAIMHSFNSCKKPLALKQDISVQLDDHYSIMFTKDYELQLVLNCQGCSIGLSLVHGALLPGRTDAGQDAESAACRRINSGLDVAGAHEVSGASGAGSDIAAAAAAAAAASADTQAVLARARALMAIEIGGTSEADTAQHADGHEVAAASTVRDSSSTTSASANVPASPTAADDNTKVLMARARALIAESHPDLV